MTSLPPPSPDAVPNQPLPPPTVPTAAVPQPLATPPMAPVADTPGTPDGPSRRGVPGWAWLVALLAVVGLAVGGVLVFTGDDDADDGDTTATTAAQADSTVPAETTVPVTLPSTTAPADSAPPDTAPPDTAPPATAPPETAPPDTAPPGPLEGEVAGAPAGITGDRTSPVPAGSIADLGDGWRLQVLDVVPDATSVVLEASEFNEPPPDGKVYTVVRVALGYFGLEDPTSAFQPTISAVGSDGVELESFCGTLSQELDYFRYMFAGGVVTGELCFVNAAADPTAIDLYASATFFGDEVVFLDVTPTTATPMAGLRAPQDGARATGPRTKPVPLGTTADVGAGWSVTVIGAARDITDAVLAEGFNDPPPAGSRYIGVDVTYAYSGDAPSGAYAVTARAISDANVEHTGRCGFVPGEIDYFSDMFDGASVSGTVCFVVPESELESLQVIFDGGFNEKPAFMAVR